MIATTDPEEGFLKQIAEREDFGLLPIPPDVGGRFSVFTPVGLLPAAVTGLDVGALLAGASQCVDEVNERGAEHPAVVGAAMHYLMDTARGRNVRVMMTYADALERLAAWLRHLQPWGVVSWHGRWYVVGHDVDRDATRVFRLSRIVDGVAFDGPAGSIEIPDDVDLTEQVRALAPTPITGVAQLRVRSRSALPLRRRATSAPPATGTTDEWSAIEVPFSDAEQLAAELSGYADDVQAVSPAEVSEALQRRLEAVVETSGTA